MNLASGADIGAHRKVMITVNLKANKLRTIDPTILGHKSEQQDKKSDQNALSQSVPATKRVIITRPN
jgi:hypothetical protein